MELDTFQLFSILKTHPCTRTIFIGVFARDQLPLKIKYPCCFIINTHKAHQRGEHWLAVYFSKQREAEFFDSFGLSPAFYNLNSYFDRTSVNIQYNSKQLQSPFSSLCGYYCCFYLISKCKKVDLDSFLSLFKENYHQNDLDITKLLNAFI